ncbi:unnamed protein product [Closterium sp. NIES-54]
MLLDPEGDPDALDIPTPRTYAEAVSRPWASQWKATMDAEMTSYRSRGTYVNKVPPLGANVVDGMWIYRVKRPPGSPPVFKVRYVARGFSQREGVDFFQTFVPNPKMTTLRVLLHVAAQRDYELHSLDFSSAFLQEGLGYNLLSVSQLMAKGIHLKADSTIQEFKLYHGRGGLYIGKAVLKNNVFVLDFVPDLGTADSDGIVTFTSWTHPLDLDPDFSPEGFWYSHTIPEAERTRALVTIQHSAAAETTSAAAETTSAAAEKTSAAAETTTAAAEKTSAAAVTTVVAAATSTPIAGDEAAYPKDANLPRYIQSGLQILSLVTAVHGTALPKEPATVQQALGGEHREKWREAMGRELKALEERNTWKIVPISVARNKTILTGKWVFRVKTKADGTIEKFKARWVVHGFDQEHRRDFTETFAPVSRHTSLRILLAIAAMKKKKLRQIDVANTFLYAPVDAEIFVELPHGSNGEPNQVCQLLKSLYGIKQAPRLWQQYLHARLIRIGFRQLPHDQGMYRLSKGDDYILLIVYVDDLLYIGSTNNITTWFEGELKQDLMLTVSTTVAQYLGLNIQEEENAIYLSAAKYTDTIAKRFRFTPTAISTPYRYTTGNQKESSVLLKPAGIRDYQQKLGCLLFAAVTCRPDLSYSASQLATYLKKPEAEHMAELDRALHYLVNTPTIGLS